LRTFLLVLIAAAAGPTAGGETVDITVHEGTSMAIALSPDRRTIAIDVQGSLWTLPATGGAARRITDEYNDARQPAWGPDGRTIAFQGYRDGTWHIWTVAPDGSGLKAVTSGPFDDREPHWSPDGARIAFSSDRSGNYDIWELDVRSGLARQLTKHPANDFSPTWSPDGKEIAFISDRVPEPGVYAITPEGTERLLASSPGTLGAPSWRPGGTQVLYGVTAAGVARLVLDGQPLVSGEDVHPFRAQWISATEFVYASDGKIRRRSIDPTKKDASTIEFTATLSLTSATYTRRKRDFDGTQPRPTLGILRPAMSPDGKRLAFVALGDLWVMPLGGRPSRLTDDRFVDSDPAWSPDGTRLAFSSDRAGGMDIWIRHLASGRDLRLTELPDAEMAAAWSPDGKRIAFIAMSGFKQGEVHVVDANGGPPRKIFDRSFGPGYPSWSPDGRFVVISALKPYSGRFREGTNHMRLIPVDGGESRLVAPFAHQSLGKRSGDGPFWSPDGRWMAFVGDGHLQVIPVGPSGNPTGPSRALTSELADSISWAGSGRILYMAADRVKLVSIEDGIAKDVLIDLTWRAKVPTGRTVVHAGRLIDMRQPAARTEMDIVIEGHRIRSVEPHRADLHTGAVVDAAGLSVMPGLVEAHGHLHREQGELFGRAHLAYGITTVRSPGAHPYEALEEREAIDSGRRIGPRVFTTGYLLDGRRPYYPLASTAADEAVVDMELDRARRLEYDLLKTYVRLPDLLQKHAIEGAHRIGIPVSSHEVYPAALSGIDSVEHLTGTSRRGYSPKRSLTGAMYEDVIQIVARSGMTITPTAVLTLGGLPGMLARDPSIVQDRRSQALSPAWVVAAMRASSGPAGGGPAADPQARAQAARRASDNLLKLLKAGARIVAGVDSPLVPYGISLHAELEAYVAAGFTPFQALQTATVNTAELLNAEIGVIEAGRLADLVMVEGDPLADIRAARNVRKVIKNGEVFDVEELLNRRIR
jgi:Tol biopolymer transport system component/imidazolonepropionase-like amidohydrolase